MRRGWEYIAESNITQHKISSMFRKTYCMILPCHTSTHFPTKVFVSLKIPENTWGKCREPDKTVEIQIPYNHLSVDTKTSRTPSCPWHRAAKQWHLLVARVCVQNTVNLPVQKGQYIRWLASGSLFKANFFVLTGLCALFLLAYFYMPYFPFPENRLILQDLVSQRKVKVNGNTTEDEDTH